MTRSGWWGVELRAATQADIDELGATASESESASVWINARLAAIGDEYGTATVADWLKRLDVTQEVVERFLEAAVALALPPGATNAGGRPDIATPDFGGISEDQDPAIIAGQVEMASAGAPKTRALLAEAWAPERVPTVPQPQLDEVYRAGDLPAGSVVASWEKLPDRREYVIGKTGMCLVWEQPVPGSQEWRVVYLGRCADGEWLTPRMRAEVDVAPTTMLGARVLMLRIERGELAGLGPDDDGYVFARRCLSLDGGAGPIVSVVIERDEGARVLKLGIERGELVGLSPGEYVITDSAEHRSQPKGDE